MKQTEYIMGINHSELCVFLFYLECLKENVLPWYEIDDYDQDHSMDLCFFHILKKHNDFWISVVILLTLTLSFSFSKQQNIFFI